MKEKSLEIYVAVHRFYKHEITPQSMKYLYMYCKLELRNKIIDFFCNWSFYNGRKEKLIWNDKIRGRMEQS